MKRMTHGLMMDLIVAVDAAGGIGKNGIIPWKLRKDMDHFVKKTSGDNDPSQVPPKRNAVIMGRKCWDSIPPNFKPLKGRLNIVLSKTMPEETTPDHWVRNSLDNAMRELADKMEDLKIERVWNIGGAEIYKWGLERGIISTIEITKIHQNFDADVMMPDINWENFRKVASSEEQEEKGVKFTFETYHKATMVKKKNTGSSQQNGPTAVESKQQNGHSKEPGTPSTINSGLTPKINGVSNGSAISNGISNGHAGLKKANNRKAPTSETASSSQCSGSDLEKRHHDKKKPMRDHECQVDLSVDDDLVEKFARLKEWRKMETLGELVSLLTPVQRKLMEAMLRGSTAHANSSTESYERRINTPRSLEAVCLKESMERQREMYLPTLSLLTPCNRQSAAVLLGQIRKFVQDLPRLQHGKNEEKVQSQTEEVLAMVVTSLHHPAFSVDAQMELAKMRDRLKTMLHDLIPYTQGQSKEELAPTIKCMHCLECKEEEQEVVLELLWTDGMMTYACRTIKQMHEMHRRLLDVFGMEKRDKDRALPYFPRTENYLSMRNYIEELANLPARMLLDVKFAEEFADTRIFSAQLSSAPVNHAPVTRRRRTEEPADDPNMNDIALGILPTVYVPPLPRSPDMPSCPYCAGYHVLEQCPTLVIKGEYVNSKAAVTNGIGPASWTNMRCNCCR
uniref:Bifunctional dihydrofolate reductase-thymidylate synthase n=1 Tax=Pristionchus pacificus TaxID=54126 RepID=A0A2A6BKN1_PRIPA|eukprot:PDM66459.1 hypothetical protein PRIPAC_47876 [Pristionchus pacificus]